MYLLTPDIQMSFCEKVSESDVFNNCSSQEYTSTGRTVNKLNIKIGGNPLAMTIVSDPEIRTVSTELTKTRYNRIAPLYNFIVHPPHDSYFLPPPEVHPTAAESSGHTGRTRDYA
jgi:hypothetical protein